MEDSNELAQRPSTAAGIIMEDYSTTAVSILPADPGEAAARLAELGQAMKDAAILLQAAEILARRDLR